MGKRGQNFTKDEDDLIRLWIKQEKPVAKLAKMLKRGRSSVYNRIDKMKAAGTFEQGVLDLGYLDEVDSDECK